MDEFILETIGLAKQFGAVTATDQLSLGIVTGELHAIIGPNGAGKTTLIAQLSGEIRPSAGLIRFAGRDITSLSMPERVHRGVVRSFQITSLCQEFTALANVALAVQVRLGHSFHLWRDARHDPAFVGPARGILEQVGLGERVDVVAGFLAHGEQRQLEIAIALASHPRLLLLDEPTAGMSREDSRIMVRLLEGLKRKYTIILVEHDMDTVFALADRITVLVYGKAIATGTHSTIREDAAVREAYLGEAAIHA